jgi:hypothetical protein
MHISDTNIVFPLQAISSLCSERGPVWQQLVSTVESSISAGLEQTGFILLMARLNGCGTCNADSYRAMLGCTTCSRQSLKRFHGTDEELASLYFQAKQELDSLTLINLQAECNLPDHKG